MKLQMWGDKVRREGLVWFLSDSFAIISDRTHPFDEFLRLKRRGQNIRVSSWPNQIVYSFCQQNLPLPCCTDHRGEWHWDTHVKLLMRPWWSPTGGGRITWSIKTRSQFKSSVANNVEDGHHQIDSSNCWCPKPERIKRKINNQVKKHQSTNLYLL